MKTTIQSIIKYGIWAIIFATTSAFAAVFTEPELPPPDGNPDAPINVGPVGQVKEGPLLIQEDFTATGIISTTDAYIGLSLSVGTPNDPQTTGLGMVGLFDGPIAATEYCDITGTDCFTANDVTTGGGTETTTSGVPAGAVMAFNLASCPTGWSTYSSATGRQIVGAGTMSYMDGDTSVSRTFTRGEVGGLSDVKTHNHYLYIKNVMSPNGTATLNTPHYSETDSSYPKTKNTGDTQSSKDLLDPYIALLYCQKN